jgi:hypothetical protein
MPADDAATPTGDHFDFEVKSDGFRCGHDRSIATASHGCSNLGAAGLINVVLLP